MALFLSTEESILFKMILLDFNGIAMKWKINKKYVYENNNQNWGVSITSPSKR